MGLDHKQLKNKEQIQVEQYLEDQEQRCFKLRRDNYEEQYIWTKPNTDQLFLQL